jgi:large subunit ribosomal protein L4
MNSISQKIENVELEFDKIFSGNTDKKKKAIGLIHRVYLTQLKNSRKYLASTKTKSEVRGGGRKPWKQKGTGRARAGSSRSPLWRGGGVSFGPKPRLVSKKVNKKERRLAILSALYLKKQQFIFVNEVALNDVKTVKTKNIVKFISDLGLNSNEKILFILTKPNKEFWLASRNLKNVEVTTSNCLNIEQLLKTTHIILSKPSLDLINSTYGKQYA